MTTPPEIGLLALSVLAIAILFAIPLYALRVRGRAYGIFALVILLLSFPAALILEARLAALLPARAAPLLAAGFGYGFLASGVHLASLVRARLRGRAVRAAISLPGMVFLAMGGLAGPFLLALLPVRLGLSLAGLDAALGALRWLDLAPLAVAALSLPTSLRLVEEVVRIPMGAAARARFAPTALERAPVERYRRRPPAPLAEAPLRIVQIADPHLGPFQSAERLRARIERLLAREPDLVCLTGDFLTMEGSGTPGALAEALAPLRPVAARCFAVFGNHDHESPEEVRSALAATGVRLLSDEEALAETPVGPVQILGAEHRFRDGGRHLGALLARHPRRAAHLRLLLLHDPLRFRDVPTDAVDLALSGHTHGGQLGLVSVGLDWTVLSRSRWPDHGLFARGTSRLYVHRGTGFYGFPLRVGVPGEASVLELVLDAPSAHVAMASAKAS
jgi:predicted MPP superfamily phosphohydrolase